MELGKRRSIVYFVFYSIHDLHLRRRGYVLIRILPEQILNKPSWPAFLPYMPVNNFACCVQFVERFPSTSVFLAFQARAKPDHAEVESRASEHSQNQQNCELTVKESRQEPVPCNECSRLSQNHMSCRVNQIQRAIVAIEQNRDAILYGNSTFSTPERSRDSMINLVDELLAVCGALVGGMEEALLRFENTVATWRLSKLSCSMI